MKHFIFICLLLISLQAFSQKNTYFGAEGGLSSERIKFPNQPIRYTSLDGSWYYFYLRKEKTRVFSWELGFSKRTLASRLYEMDELYFHLPYDRVYQFPLLLRADKNIYKERIALYTSFGIVHCFEEGSNGSGSTGNTETWTSTSANYGPSSYILFAGNIGIEFTLFNNLLFTFSGGIHRGYKMIREYELGIWDESGHIMSYKPYSKGDYLSLSMGLSYPINVAANQLKSLSERISNAFYE